MQPPGRFGIIDFEKNKIKGFKEKPDGDGNWINGGFFVLEPNIFDMIKDDVLINDDVFELQELPRTLAVIGTGIIGLELGQSLHRLGVKTTFFARSDRLGALTDPVVQENAQEILIKELNFKIGRAHV